MRRSCYFSIANISLKMRDALLQSRHFALGQVLRASGHDAARQFDKRRFLIGALGRACNITESPDQPQTHRQVGSGIVADLIERGVDKSVKRDPGDNEPQNMRWRIVSRFRRLPAQPMDYDTG